MNLKMDERILAWGIGTLISVFVCGPFCLLFGLRTRSLALDAAIRSLNTADGFNPQIVKIGSAFGIVGIIVGAVEVGLIVLSLLYSLLISAF